MPSINIEVPDENSDIYGNSQGVLTTTGTLYVGSLSASNSDGQIAVYIPLASAIARYNVASEAALNLYSVGAPGSALTVEVHLIKALNPGIPASAAAISGATRTTAKSEFVLTAQAAGWKAFDITAALNEVLQTGAVSSIVVLLRDKVRSYVGNNRNGFRPWGFGAGFRPYLTATYDAPPARTGSIKKRMPAPRRTMVGSFPTATTGSIKRRAGAAREMQASVGTPPEVVARVLRRMPAPRRVMGGGQGDPKRNTLFTFERFSFDTHHLVTESGEVYGFTGQLPTVLGGVRDSMAGNADDAWIPEAGTRARVSGSMSFSAVLFERDHPKRDGDVLERILPDVREIHFPDGRVLEVWDILLTNRPAPNRLELTARPRGSVLTQALDKAELVAAFKTESWTPELPLYAIDAGGGITAPLSVTQVDRGALGFAVRLEERGVLPLASVGRPIESDGSSDPVSLTLSYRDKHLHASLRGELTRIREVALGPFGEVLVLLLMWTRFRAHLVSCSSQGTRWHELPIGAPAALSERIVTWGRDANGIGLGAYLALGSASYDLPQLSLKTLDHPKAERVVQDVYSELSDPSRSWAITPPDYTLTLTRADTKAMELAPGESVSLDFAVTRGGGYEGGIDPLAITTPEGISASQSVLSDTGGVKTIRVTFSAPVGTPEASYPIRLEAKATGADAPGSLLSETRDTLDGMLGVAASPVIAANATWLHLPNDPVQRRPSVIAQDFSTNANVWSWHGYARIGRQGKSILVVGKEGAAVSSAVLSNAAQAQRMNAQASACMILLEPAKTKVGGIVFAFNADGGSGSVANGAALRRAQGGWGLRTALAGVETDSPDILPLSEGNAELGMRITPTEVILTDGLTMRSIRMARPAWPDAGVRGTFGARRTPAGAFADLGRAHVAAVCGHPYALTDLELRRTLDKLRESVVVSDGKPEHADGLFIWSQFGDATAQQPNEKLRNYAAPAVGPSWQAVGAVTYPTGAVQLPGEDTSIFTTRFVDFTDGDYEVVAVLNNLSQSARYDFHFAVAALGKYNGYFGIGKYYTGNPILRTLNDGATIIQKELVGSAKTGKLIVVFTVTLAGRVIKMTDLATGRSVSIDRGASATGKKSFSWGGAYARGGNDADPEGSWRNKFPGDTTGVETFVHKGLYSAQETADLRTLLLP